MREARDWIGLGVAGNFTGHLEQAGEAADFTDVVAEAGAPKGVFPFYVPGGGEHFLHVDPVSSDRILCPEGEHPIQMEPELALWCDLVYGADGVEAVHPTHFQAHDDCSIRRPGASKISQKKNWGACSKGVARTRLAIDRFEPGGCMDHYRLASYLIRDGVLHAYGVDSPVTGYSYFHGRLLAWLVQCLNAQRDEGPLEDIAQWLARCGRPERALISIGATRYTDFGESHFLEPGDRALVAVYDARRHDPDELRERLAADPEAEPEGTSLLSQRVEQG